MTRLCNSARASEYHSRVMAAVVVYVAGMVVALMRTDARWPTRLTLALLWPVGPLAFVLTVSLLLAASLIAFPLWGALVGGGLLAWRLLF
jgi:hypothetical protein